MRESKELFCLGDIVHNDMEVKRLGKKGLSIINYDKLKNIKTRSIGPAGNSGRVTTLDVFIDNPEIIYIKTTK